MSSWVGAAYKAYKAYKKSKKVGPTIKSIPPFSQKTVYGGPPGTKWVSAEKRAQWAKTHGEWKAKTEPSMKKSKIEKEAKEKAKVKEFMEKK